MGDQRISIRSMKLDQHSGHQQVERSQELMECLKNNQKIIKPTYKSMSQSEWNLVKLAPYWQRSYLLNLYAEYMLREAGLEEDEQVFKTEGRNINNLHYVGDTALITLNANNLQGLVMKGKEHSEKMVLKIKDKEDQTNDNSYSKQPQ